MNHFGLLCLLCDLDLNQNHLGVLLKGGRNYFWLQIVKSPPNVRGKESPLLDHLTMYFVVFVSVPR